MANILVENSSGLVIPVTANPYDGLLEVCDNNPKTIQGVYESHRTVRNAKQKDIVLSEDFKAWILDDVLVKLDGVQKDPEFVDPRNCFVSWARPPQKVKNLIDIIQSKLKDAAPDLWLMPLDNLHMTTLEITFSRTEDEIDDLVAKFEPHCQAYADYTRTHRTRLIKPMLNFDAAALALSFVPASGECPPKDRKAAEDDYTYHHLRRDLHEILTDTGVDVGSRYVVPTAHLTVARFNSPNPFGGNPLDGEAGVDMKKRKHWVKEIEMINKWLEAEYWPTGLHGQIKPGGEWLVGEEKGLDIRKGRLWYGGGETIYLGKGF